MTIRTNDLSKRRDKLVIMAEIMDIAKHGALKTQIMYRANLSFSQLKDYLRLLTDSNLLARSIRDGKQVYRATEKGIDFLNRHEGIMGLLDENQIVGDIRVPPESLLGQINRKS